MALNFSYIRSMEWDSWSVYSKYLEQSKTRFCYTSKSVNTSANLYLWQL